MNNELEQKIPKEAETIHSGRKKISTTQKRCEKESKEGKSNTVIRGLREEEAVTKPTVEYLLEKKPNVKSKVKLMG